MAPPSETGGNIGRDSAVSRRGRKVEPSCQVPISLDKRSKASFLI